MAAVQNMYLASILCTKYAYESGLRVGYIHSQPVLDSRCRFKYSTECMRHKFLPELLVRF
jgi:hypothetical protein